MIVLAPTITKLPPNAAGSVLISASHGGSYVGYLSARSGARAVILNDAGVGRDEAGIGALALCESVGMAAATVSTASARIGDAVDMLDHGVISHANALARTLKVSNGMSCAQAAKLLGMSPIPTSQPEPYAEARFLIGKNQYNLDIVGLDSVSLVQPSDAGQIVITGSHGGVVGGNPSLAIRVAARAAFYNDAGGGKDLAGITRLRALDERDIIAGTVSASTARIGDAKSSYQHGHLSHTNECATAFNIIPGMTLKAACELITKA